MSTPRRSRPMSAPIPRLATLLVLPVAMVACDQPVQPDGLSAPGAVDRADRAATYRVTVTNTTGALQPLTPSLVALHNQDAPALFQVGAKAGPELERIAESGNNGPLMALLAATDEVFDVDVVGGGPILPGASGSVDIQGPPGRGLRLSLVSMLVCTNDGMTGLTSVELPKKVNDVVTYETDGYDAGTEQNTEAADDLVPPCVEATTGSMGGTGADQPSVAEDLTVRHHPGIDAGGIGGILTDAQHGWSDPVAKITIERVN